MDKSNWRRYRKKRKPFVGYAVILMFYFLAQGIFGITFPIYLSNIGYSYTDIGSLLASCGLIIAVFKVLVGKHSDRVGKKRYVQGGLLSEALIMLLFLLATEKWHYAVLMLLKGAANGAFMAVRAPLIRETTNEKNRGKAFGYISAISSLGMAIGGGLAGVVIEQKAIEGIFAVNAFLLAFAFLIGMKGISENKQTNKLKKTDTRDKNTTGHFSMIDSLTSISPMIWFLCAINFIQCAVNTPLWSLVLPLHITKTLGISMVIMGYIYTIDNVMSVLDSIVGGYLSDRWKPEKMFVTFMFTAMILSIALMFVRREVLFVVLLLMFMTAFGLNSPIQEKLESACVKDDSAGLELGMISLAVTLGGSVGQYFLGWVMEYFSTRSVFFVVGIGYLVVIVLWKVGYGKGVREKR